jgi:serine/tyrosine/threonine adenylyltransferase
MSLVFQPEKTILDLGDAFYDAVSPAAFPKHIIRFRNTHHAARVGLGDLTDENWIGHFGKFEPFAGSLPQPLALKYHGHQFRHYNPDIGDGRGFLFAQLREPGTQRLLDFGTKGSGRTPFSRSGDGRLTLKGGMREVLATEMLEALGVNTSKTFSLIETGEALSRNDEPSPTRSAVLVRLSHSHIRYGTFQRLAYFQQAPEMKQLLDYCLTHLLPGTTAITLDEKVITVLSHAVQGAATLSASYMAAGFVHGVLNTDNINITGESFDYGPYRFAPHYDLAFTAAYFDQFGLYAFGRQAEALHWNVYQLAKSLLTVVPQEVVIPVLETFPQKFEAALIKKIFARLGVTPHADTQLNLAVLQAMETALIETHQSLDAFYHDWFGGTCRAADKYQHPLFAPLREALAACAPHPTAHTRLREEYFSQPAPCSLLIDEIEAIWSAIDLNDDWSLFYAKIEAIRTMGNALGLSDHARASLSTLP